MPCPYLGAEAREGAAGAGAGKARDRACLSLRRLGLLMPLLLQLRHELGPKLLGPLHAVGHVDAPQHLEQAQQVVVLAAVQDLAALAEHDGGYKELEELGAVGARVWLWGRCGSWRLLLLR